MPKLKKDNAYRLALRHGQDLDDQVPWERFSEFDIFRVKVGSAEYTCTFVGQVGASFGLSLFPGPEGLALVARAYSQDSAVETDFKRLSAGHEQWLLSLDPPEKIPFEAKRIHKRAKLKPRGDGYLPSLLRKSPHGDLAVMSPEGHIQLGLIVGGVVAALTSGVLKPGQTWTQERITCLHISGTLAAPRVLATDDPVGILGPRPTDALLPPGMVAELADLPVLEEEWEALCLSQPCKIGDPLGDIHIFAVCARDAFRIVEVEVFRGEEIHGVVAELLVEWMKVGQGPEHPPGRPRRLVVWAPDLAADLYPTLGAAGIALDVDPEPAAAALVLKTLIERDDDPLGLETQGAWAEEDDRAEGDAWGADGEDDSWGEDDPWEEGEGPFGAAYAEARARLPEEVQRVKDADNGLTKRFLKRFAEEALLDRPRIKRYFGDADIAEILSHEELPVAFAGYLQWYMRAAPKGGLTPVQRFRKNEALTALEDEILSEMETVPPTLLIVRAVDPEAMTLTLEDLLLGGTHKAYDAALSQGAPVNLAFPSRIFTVRGVSLVEEPGVTLSPVVLPKAIAHLESLGLKTTAAGLRKDGHLFGHLWRWRRTQRDQASGWG